MRRLTRSVFSEEKKLSIAELCQTSPERLMLQTMPSSPASVRVTGRQKWPVSNFESSGNGARSIPLTLLAASIMVRLDHKPTSSHASRISRGPTSPKESKCRVAANSGPCANGAGDDGWAYFFPCWRSAVAAEAGAVRPITTARPAFLPRCNSARLQATSSRVSPPCSLGRPRTRPRAPHPDLGVGQRQRAGAR